MMPEPKASSFVGVDCTRLTTGVPAMTRPMTLVPPDCVKILRQDEVRGDVAVARRRTAKGVRQQEGEPPGGLKQPTRSSQRGGTFDSTTCSRKRSTRGW